MASDLISSVIHCSKEPVRLCPIRDRRPVCEAFDGSSAAPVSVVLGPFDEGGRGLPLVSRFGEGRRAGDDAEGKSMRMQRCLYSPAPDLAAEPASGS